MSIIMKIIAEVHGGNYNEQSLAAACMDIKQARLEHLVTDPSIAEIQALAVAGEELAKARAALLVSCFTRPSEALEPYDGGAAKQAEVMAEAWSRVQ